ncbi:nucleotidyltransferase family protein [Trinickia sp. EG282A]|uniref:nucleotidyltransferase family protein n=1 Tax=Trinickia sp. EG282A TaxID=3237013 RepID=UPI0034D28C94
MQTLKDHPLDGATDRAVRAFLRQITALYPIRGAVLYGSRARGDNRPDSDADVAVLLPGAPTQYWQIVRTMSDVAFDVMIETGILVQALPIWEDEWSDPDAYSNPTLLRKIEHDGVRVS